jgi:polar amino acid transport system substrate-binding protein
MRVLPIFFALAVLTIGCGSMPRDPAGTLERIQQRQHIRVGLVECPPWVIRAQGDPGGVEVELVKQFAGEFGTACDWYWGNEQRHMAALEHFELDLVVGGLDKSTPWREIVGVTKPYYEELYTVGVPRGTSPPDNLDGLQIAAQAGEATAAYLAKKHALVLRVPDVSHSHGPAAAPEWRLQQMGFVLTKHQLLTRKHVMAVPPGENAWLQRLETFLFDRRSQVPGLLLEKQGGAQ